MRVLLTGGAGFIGSHIVDAYLDAGAEVTVIDDLSSGKMANLDRRATFHHLPLQAPALRQLLRDGQFDLINHQAARADVRRSVADPLEDAETNLFGLLNLLEGAVEMGVPRLVFASSGGVIYGEAETLPTPEAAPKHPTSPYGVAKLAGEHYLECYRMVHGLHYVALRYGNVYGPRQDPHGEAGVIAIFSSRLAEGRELTVFGDGTQERDFVYVEDVVRANLLAGDVPVSGEGIDDRAWNVGTGKGTSVNQLIGMLGRIARVEPRVEHAPPRTGELSHSVLDPARIERELGWRPEISLEEGLGRTYQQLSWSSGRKSASFLKV